MLEQDAAQRASDWDDAATGSGLRRDHPAADVAVGLLDVEFTGVEVDVPPSHAAELAEPQASVERERPQRAVLSGERRDER